MNLNKYYTFLDMSEYIKKESSIRDRIYYEIEDIKCSGYDQIDKEGNIYNDSWAMRTMRILITEDDEDIINAHLENFGDYPKFCVNGQLQG